MRYSFIDRLQRNQRQNLTIFLLIQTKRQIFINLSNC